MHSVLKIDVAPRPGAHLIVPTGITTPYHDVRAFQVSTPIERMLIEPRTGQQVALVAGDEPVHIEYEYGIGTAYPNCMFDPRDCAFTQAAQSLAGEGAKMASAGIDAIVQHVAALFTYGHPDNSFYDGETAVPQLCGLTEGSCVDINLYLIALLRAAGYEAGYITGYFFPEEKGGTTTDMHCWVVTRDRGQTLEWDIAHHLKMGTRHIRPGLNPKPGWRVPVAHSMGLDLPALGISGLKLLAEPMWLAEDRADRPELEIRIQPGRASERSAA